MSPSSAAAISQPPRALSIEGVSKSFDGEKALDSVSLEVARGEIHGLLGHNGSGKSTLIKILAGFYTADSYHDFALNGEEVSLPIPPTVARERGLAFVHQDLGLVGPATVAENLSVTQFAGSPRFFVRWGREVESCQALLDKYGIAVSPRARVADLQPVEKAMVAIARALREIEAGAGQNEKLLVLDEPTAHLPRADVSDLFDVLRAMRNEGVSAIFVSHRTEEVLEITDRVTVLRDGRCVGTRATDTLTARDIELLILGEQAASHRVEAARQADGSENVAPGPTAPEPQGQPAQADIRVEGLCGDIVDDISFEIRPGEILGLTGLASSGATDVPGMIFGAKHAQQGKLTLRGRTYDLSRLKPHQAISNGVAFVPGDRLAQALIGELSLLENVVPLVGKQYSKLGRLQRRRLSRDARANFAALSVRPALPERKASALSGGNQQKVVLSKWMWNNPALLLLEEPTQGVDIGATEDIFRVIRQATSQGTAVLCAATDEDDLAQICDRVLVIRDGRVVAELAHGQVTKESMRRAAG